MALGVKAIQVMDPEIEPESSFLRKRQLSIYWYNKSSDLRGSSAALWASMDEPRSTSIVEELGLGQGFSIRVAAFPVWLMISGMALELLYKAIIIAKRHEPASIHDLPRLAEQAQVPMTEKEIGLLRILSESIVWAGRYPVPKKERQMKTFHGLIDRHLYEKVPNSKTFRRPNRALNWKSFNDMWGKASTVYWENHS
jgi:hypothetical protein